MKFQTATGGIWLALFMTAAVGVCPAQIPFFSSNSIATCTKIQGQVSVMRDSYPWALSQGNTIQPQQMIMSGPDGYAVFQVSDGSTFEVFPDSKVIFRANPGSLKDLVDMVIGRIRVHIEKIGGQPNPNNVKTPSAVISVRGTIFDVIVDPEDSTTVAVTEGLVAVRHAVRVSRTEKLVGAGEVLVVYKNEPLAKRGADKDVIAARVFRGLQDMAITIIRNGGLGGRSGSGAPGTGGGTGGVGDTKSPTPPPPPAPAPPPPAPPEK